MILSDVRDGSTVLERMKRAAEEQKEAESASAESQREEQRMNMS